MLRRTALNCLGDVVLGAISRRFSGFGVEPLDQICRVVPCFSLNLLQQEIFGFLGRQTGDALELVLLLSDKPLVLGSGCPRGFLALGDGPIAGVQLALQTLDRALAFAECPLAAGQRLLERSRRLPYLAGLPLGFDEKFV